MQEHCKRLMRFKNFILASRIICGSVFITQCWLMDWRWGLLNMMSTDGLSQDHTRDLWWWSSVTRKEDFGTHRPTKRSSRMMFNKERENVKPDNKGSLRLVYPSKLAALLRCTYKFFDTRILTNEKSSDDQPGACGS